MAGTEEVRVLTQQRNKVIYPVNDIKSVIGLEEALGGLELTGLVGEHASIIVDRVNRKISIQLNDSFISAIDFMRAEIDYLKENMSQGGLVAGTLGDKSPGDIVHIYMHGQFRTFLVWHNDGNPSSDYDGYDDAVFLLQLGVFEPMRWGDATAGADYANSERHLWFNDASSGFLSMLPEWFRNGYLIQGRIPYRIGNVGHEVGVGANGLLCSAFLPSQTELGVTSAWDAVPLGVNFGLFPTDASRVARDGFNNPRAYWTRTVSHAATNSVNGVSATGMNNAGNVATATSHWIRLALAAQKSTPLDANNILFQGTTSKTNVGIKALASAVTNRPVLRIRG